MKNYDVSTSFKASVLIDVKAKDEKEARGKMIDILNDMRDKGLIIPDNEFLNIEVDEYQEW